MFNSIRNLFSGLVGPTAVMAAGTMGAGAAASLILAGAWFRYDLLWVIPLVLPLFVISVDSASRIGLLNPKKGMFSLIGEHIHPSVAWLIFAINIPVHLLIGMGQMSVMTSALMSLFTYYPPDLYSSEAYRSGYRMAEIAVSLTTAGGLVWLLTSGGYQRMQKIMSALMVVMFISFMIVALTGLQDIVAILKGFIPSIPADVPVPASTDSRLATSSIIAIVGSALAPAALLGIPYMCADNLRGAPNLPAEFKRSIINLGLIFGGYSIFVIIAGGFALHPLSHHAAIDTVHEAGRVLSNAFPPALDFMGPLVFTVGLMIAALTTFVVVVQVVCYFCLDMFGKNWHDTEDNTAFKRLLVFWVVLPAALAPFWSFPALLKVVLLMGFNAIVIPVVILIVIALVNNRGLMGENKASWPRNVTLTIALLLSFWLMWEKLPEYIAMMTG